MVSLLPHRLLLFLGARLGRLLMRVLKSRRVVAARNLELCFPEWTAEQRAQALQQSFESAGQLVFEVGMAWWYSVRRLRPWYRIEGLEHLEKARAEGRGVLLLFCHFTPMELVGRLLALHAPLAALYREHGNEALEVMVRRQRLRYGDSLFNRNELRAMVRYLRQGGALWYAPDQDYERGDRRFAPLFGIPAATITSGVDLARMGKARVLMSAVVRDASGRYLIRVSDPLPEVPSGDVDDDLAAINRAVESAIRQNPDQYLWLHRRFKNRPEGEPGLY